MELCRRIKRDSATRLITIVLLSDDRRKEHRLAGIEAGAEAVLVKPFDTDELLARVRVASRVSQYTNDLDSAAAIIMTVTAMIEARESSPGHCFRMANYATALGRAIHLGDADLKALYRGAFLHDIGMLSIPDGILRKDGRLEPEEYEVVKSHPVIGDALCANLRTLHPVRPIVRHHHERLDGSGYPDRLKGDQVPLLAQIVSIVDLFEAMTMGREYVAPRSATEALTVLGHETQLGWRQPELVEAFAALVQSGALERFQGAAAGGSGRPGRPGTRPVADRGNGGSRGLGPPPVAGAPPARRRCRCYTRRMRHTRRYLVSGRVQGVGFRLVRRRLCPARRLGRPRAKPARRVRGSRGRRRPREPDAAGGGALAGPSRARVEDVVIDELEPLGLADGFAIR